MMSVAVAGWAARAARMAGERVLGRRADQWRPGGGRRERAGLGRPEGQNEGYVNLESSLIPRLLRDFPPP
jgi:hypothetical protein